MDILANRRAFVAVELGNRADLSQQATNFGPSRIDNWIWQSYLNIGMSYTFSEQDDTETDQWQQNQDSIDFPTLARAIKNVAFYQQDGTAIKVDWKDVNYLRRYAVNPQNQQVGPPSLIATYGLQILVRPLCDQNIYNVIIDFQDKPVQIVGEDSPAPFPYTSQGTADIGSTLLQVPDDWNELIDMGAMMRGHASLGEVDKANALQQTLFGFTVPTTGKVVPGLMAAYYNRRQVQAPNMDYGMAPRSTKRSFTNTGG